MIFKTTQYPCWKRHFTWWPMYVEDKLVWLQIIEAYYERGYYGDVSVTETRFIK